MTVAIMRSCALRTSLGSTVDDVVARLIAGERAGRMARISAEPAPSRHGRFLPRLALLALETAQEAATRAALAGGERIGVFAAVGGLRVEWNELGPVLADQRDDGAGAWLCGLDKIHPFWMLRHLSNNAHALIAATLGARGEGATFGGATAGAQAIASAARALAARTIDAAVVVAYDSLLAPETLVDLEARGVIATADVVAPYHDASCGMFPGEATAAIVLVGDGHGPRLRAASGADGEASEPRDTTIARVAARACGDARDIVVDGAARARPDRDVGERLALVEIVGEDAPLIATMGTTGSLGAASALVQAIALGELLQRRVLPPIARPSRFSSGPLRPVGQPAATACRAALCLSTGAPGLAAAVHVELAP